MKNKKFTEILKNILLSLMVFMLLFIILEISLKTYYSKNYNIEKFRNLDKDESMMLSRFVPNNTINHYKYYTTLNSAGLRDREYKKEKPENVTRIAILGDSYSFGVGIKENNDTYSEVLEHYLNNNHNVEVIDFSITGASFLDIYWMMDYEVVAFNPDIVIYAFKENNLLMVPYNADYPFCYNVFGESTATSYFVTNRWNKFLSNFIYIKPSVYKRDFLPYLNWHCFSQMLKNSNTLAENNNFDFIVFLYPMDTSSTYLSNITHKRLISKAEEYNITIIKTFPDKFWDKTKNYKEEELIIDKENDEFHYTKKVHGYIAEILFEYLIKNQKLYEKKI